MPWNYLTILQLRCWSLWRDQQFHFTHNGGYYNSSMLRLSPSISIQGALCISLCILFHNVTLSIVRPIRPRWVNTVSCYCCPFLYLCMCLSTVTERVPIGQAGPEFAPVPGNFLGPRASTGACPFHEILSNWNIKKYRLYHKKSTDTDAILISLLDWCADVSFLPCFVCVMCM